MIRPLTARPSTLAWGLATLLATTASWCTVYGRWSVASWKAPVHYWGDALYVLGLSRAFQLGEIYPVVFKEVARLNAPHTANWNDFPVINEMLYWSIGMVARVVGLFPAANVVLLGLHLLAAAAFFVAARKVGAHAALAAAGGVLFASSKFFWHRGLPHLMLTSCWHIPIFLLVVWWVLRDEVWVSRRRRLAALAVALVTGIQNPYFTNVFVQLLGVVTVVAMLRRDGRRVRWALGLGAVALAGFVLMNLDTLLYAALHGSNFDIARRGVASLAALDLRPIELFLPREHRVEALERFVHDAYTFPLRGSFALLRPHQSTYLGATALAALVGLTVHGARRLIDGRGRDVSAAFWGVGWVLLYSIPGGLNWFVSVFFGFHLFRGTERYAVVLSALVLLFAARGLSRLGSSRRLAIAGVVIGALGWWEQTPDPARFADPRWADMASSDRAFVAGVEAHVKRGAALFQLPVISYPEDRSPAGLTTYSLLRPYLHSDHLRLSSGEHRGRGREDWQRGLMERPPRDIVALLKEKGFAGIVLHRRGLGPREEHFEEQLPSLAAGPPLVSQRDDLVFFPFEVASLPVPASRR